MGVSRWVPVFDIAIPQRLGPSDRSRPLATVGLDPGIGPSGDQRPKGGPATRGEPANLSDRNL